MSGQSVVEPRVCPTFFHFIAGRWTGNITPPPLPVPPGYIEIGFTVYYS